MCLRRSGIPTPDGLESYLDEEAARQQRERPKILSFVVDDGETVEAAIKKAQSAQAGGLTRGGALVQISRYYLRAGLGEKE
jgi:hypothetical protein